MLRPVGFEEDEGVLPYPRRSFIGYRLLQEYFTFPEKFFFIDLTGLDEVVGRRVQGSRGDRVPDVALRSNERKQMLEVGVSAKTFRLGCTPIVNLFPQTAEPILLDQRKLRIPDRSRMCAGRNATEIFSVDEVVSINPQTGETMRFEPFYSYRHAAIRDNKQTFWMANAPAPPD